MALGLGSPAGSAGISISVTAFMAVAWAALLRVRSLSPRWCQLLTGLCLGATSIMVWVGHGGDLSFGYLAFMVPIGIFAGLFLGVRAVIGLLFLGATLAGVALVSTQGIEAATLIAVAFGLAEASATMTVALLVRSARRHGTMDPDTGLPNGFGLAERIASRLGQPSFVVAVTLLSGLSEAREALGYQVGTELLRRAVEDLGQVLPPGALLGRVEGDELVTILTLNHDPVLDSEQAAAATHPAASGAARTLAQTSVLAIAAGHYLVDGVEVSLRAHVGLALAPWDGDEVAELVRRASLSARRAEAAGQTDRFWDGDRGAMTADDLTVLADLRLAAARRELWLAYQPQVAAVSGRAVSVESLLRWDSPTHGTVSPGRFIPLAERTGLIDRLTDWVLAEALDAQVRWRQAGLDLPVAVNLSAKSLTRPDLPEWVLQEMRIRDLPSHCLTVEVTETAATADLMQAVSLLRPLHDSGVRISLDDFGTGYTSLAALPHLPLDELKVDQSFVGRSSTSPADEAIVRSVSGLARRLGLDVVAEGVEDRRTAERMIEFGFDLLQGYYFAKPMSEGDLLQFVNNHQPRHDGGSDSRKLPSSYPAQPVTMGGTLTAFG